QATVESNFLTYDGGGVDFWGKDKGRDIQFENLGQNWDGAVGVSEDDAPIDSKWSIAGGGSRDVGDGVRIGAFASFFYERDSSYFENGIDDSYWVEKPGAKMTPQTFQGTVMDGDFKTGLFDVRQSTQSVQWGGLASVGLETEDHAIGLSYLYTRIAEDTTTLAEDTRGKEYFFPGYDPNNPKGTGNEPNNLNAAPYIRLETLDYTERTTGTLQLNGRHKLPFEGFDVADFVRFRRPELDWVVAGSSATLDQPDKRQFGSRWLAPAFNRGIPPFIPPFTTPPTHLPYQPGANFTLGNLQRIWKEIEEDSEQYSLNLKLPFEQWGGHEGYLKTGLFNDQVDREFDQETFSNFNDPGASFIGPWSSFWSKNFPKEDHPITASLEDVDYEGDLDLSAWYAMLDLPLTSNLNAIGGARFETTEIGITIFPEKNATWFSPLSPGPVTLNPGDADVDFSQDDVLPSFGLVYEPIEKVTLRGSFSETVARQTFKELTPVLQQEFAGGPVFIGNPDLGMSSLENYDMRVDYAPYEGSLLSLSWFDKHVEDPIEYVQKVGTFNYTTAVNYPKGELSGFELEARQSLGRFWESLSAFSVGANATFIDSEVDLPLDEITAFNELGVSMTSRDMTLAPEHLYNLFVTYDLASTGTQVGLFYTVQGDTLIAGAAESKEGFFVPSIYATEFDTLNLSVTQRLGRHFKLHLQGKNLTNPEIETVYRSEFIGDDVLKTSYRAGFEVSVGISAEFSF
ncbi:MAG TPA: TonB-dependent receptor, partial [Planctomycetota bacterium]|nr:TonB-dependent receptor [Planctomycetota bacterium]